MLSSICAQNGTYESVRHETRSEKPENDVMSNSKAVIVVEIYGVGGKDYVSVTLPDESSPVQKRTTQWNVDEELQMSPNATSKSVFKSYAASLAPEKGKGDYQVSLIKGEKSGKLSLTIIDEEGNSQWFYDLEKIK
jgi:hypothetical protein